MAVDNDIQIDDLTTSETDGRGVFDEMMRAINANIEREHKAGRITSGDYAKVYLGAVEAALTQSVGFVLQKGRASKEIDLLDAQIRKTEVDITIATKQLELMDKQIEQADAEIALLGQRLLTEVEQTKLVTAQAANATKQGVILDTQKLKTEAEIAVLVENKWNSQAQRLDTVNGQVVKGVIGKQTALYAAQTDGFKRDAEQKLLKIAVDMWSVSRTTNDAVEVPNKFNNTSIDELATQARQGVGLND